MTPCVTRELRDANEGARTRVRGYLHSGARGILAERWAASLGNLARSVGFYEVRTADEDENDGGKRSKTWGVSEECILEVVDPTIAAISAQASDEKA